MEKLGFSISAKRKEHEGNHLAAGHQCEHEPNLTAPNLMKKLDIHGMAGLVRYALRNRS
jgi:hypothetical protein